MQAAINNNPRFFSSRKHSVQPSARAAIESTENALELSGGDDYAPSFRKKTSVQYQGSKPLNQRALTSMNYTSQAPPQGVRQTTADPSNRAGARFKKMGNLTSLE